MLGFIGKVGSRKVVGNLDFLAILAVCHHRIAFDAIHIAIATVAGACFGGRFGVQLDRLVVHESSGAVVVAAFQKVVIDIGVEVVDHGFRDHVHISIVTRSRRTVIDHGDTTDGATSPGSHPSNIHLIHGGDQERLPPSPIVRSSKRVVQKSKYRNAHPPVLAVS